MPRSITKKTLIFQLVNDAFPILIEILFLDLERYGKPFSEIRKAWRRDFVTRHGRAANSARLS